LSIPMPMVPPHGESFASGIPEETRQRLSG
jgi:hypothetical protein